MTEATTTTTTTATTMASSLSRTTGTGSSHPIFMVTVSAPTNIAVIKYWGKANEQYNTPINSSLSVTLDQNDLCAVTTVAASYSFTSDKLWLNGIEDTSASTNRRFRACIDSIKQLVSDNDSEVLASDGITKVKVSKQDWIEMKIHVSSYNTFPTAAGLASSAAGYAALVYGLGQLMSIQESFIGQLSTIARQGSGSACRSLYGGYVAWYHGSENNNWNDSKAVQIASEHDWSTIKTIILVVSDDKKDTSSTSGMKTSVETSTLLHYRATNIVPNRMIEMEQSIQSKNFTNFAVLTMKDSNQFHTICLDTYPPIFYMNDTSRLIIRLITIYNNYYNTEKVAYTFDAGPNAVLYMLDDTLVEISALIVHYFPIKSDDTNIDSLLDKFIVSKSNPTVRQQIQSYTLDSKLLHECDKVFGTSSGTTTTVVSADNPEGSTTKTTTSTSTTTSSSTTTNTSTTTSSTTTTTINSGLIKMMYVTQPGPGPQVLSQNYSNLDPKTGLNIYQKPV